MTSPLPSAEQILADLALVANRFLSLAVAWHVVVIVAAAALALGVRPSKRVAAFLLIAPLVSVSAVSSTTSNPFNGAVFASLSVVLAVVATGVASTPLSRAPAWAISLGASTVAYAWVYPHFLDARPPALYFVAAPMGLLPCPTLALVLGIGLCADGLGSRVWALVMGFAGLFFALFGVLRLGVWLDTGLLIAALATLVIAAIGARAIPSNRGRVRST